LRLLGMLLGVGFAVTRSSGLGVSAACAALVASTALETLFLSMTAWPRGRVLWTSGTAGTAWGAVARGTPPPAGSLMVWTFLRPVIHSVRGRLSDPELAQASFGVIQPIVLVACSPLWALQDVSLVLARRRSDLGSLIRFAAVTAAVFTAIVALLTLTPLR